MSKYLPVTFGIAVLLMASTALARSGLPWSQPASATREQTAWQLLPMALRKHLQEYNPMQRHKE